MIHQWARARGAASLCVSEWDVAADIASGDLVRLLPTFKLSDANVIVLACANVIAPACAKGLPLRTRSFLQFLQERFLPLPPLRQGPQ